MIGRLLPPGVAYAETFTDVAESTLYPAEAALVARAVEKRRREFATARHCARQALGRLGMPPVPLLPGEGGAPQWPAGIVGSMTHCDGYRAAAVARVTDLLSLGVDAEPHDPLPAGVLAMIALPEEVTMVGRLTHADGGTCWDRLLFCAKEAVYKAWFPLARRWLDFQQASVTLVPGGTLVTRLLVDGPILDGAELTGFTGRWRVERGLALAAVTVPTSQPPTPPLGPARYSASAAYAGPLHATGGPAPPATGVRPARAAGSPALPGQAVPQDRHRPTGVRQLSTRAAKARRYPGLRQAPRGGGETTTQTPRRAC